MPRSDFFVQRSFTDIDELSLLARAWDLDFRQLSRGEFQGSVVQFGCDRFHIGRTQLRGVLHQWGSAPRKLRTFAFSVAGEMRLLWRGHELGADEVLIIPGGEELESASQPDFDMFVLSIEERRLDQAARGLGVTGSWGSTRGQEAVRCQANSLSALRRWCASAVSAIARRPGTLAYAEVMASLESRAAELLALTLACGRTAHAGPSAVRRARLTEEATRIARNFQGANLNLSELCERVGASERTLRRGFQERFGVSPMAYLKAQRLIGAHRALREARPTLAQVSDIANLYGFWHMGQFAADYRGHFGELPSATLAGPGIRS